VDEAVSVHVNLKLARLKAGLSQEEVAGSLGTTIDRVCNLETGRTKLKADDAQRLARIYGVEIDELIGKKEHQETPISPIHPAFARFLANLQMHQELLWTPEELAQIANLNWTGGLDLACDIYRAALLAVRNGDRSA